MADDKARIAFENVLAAQRVALRAAGSIGWAPPEDLEDYTPYDLWDEAVKVFPHALQREFDPEQNEDVGNDEVTVSLMAEVALSEDSGISLSAVCSLSGDADGDGVYTHKTEKLDYTLWVDNKDWSGDTVAKLRGHLHQFQNTLRERDPVGYAKVAGKP